MKNLNAVQSHIPCINTYLLAAVFFMIPIKVGPAYILSGLILFLWLLEGGIKAKWRELVAHPLTWVFWLYALIPVISLLWSQDLLWGVMMAKRSFFFLLFPLYSSVASKKNVKFYIVFFIASVVITMFLAYYNWFQLHIFTGLPQGIRNDHDAWQIAPFVDSIMYNPILAFGAYLVGHAVLFENLHGLRKLACLIILVAMSVNMFISGGRSGQVGFIAMVALLIFQRFARRKVVAVLVALGVTGGIVVAAYKVNPLFRQRADLAIYEVTHYKNVVNSSVGLRINYAANAYRIFEKAPLLGVGVGDYPAEYVRINTEHTPQWGVDFNPHNQYLFVLSTTGLIGGASLICVLFWPLYFSRKEINEWSRMRVALSLLLTVICFGESYLWRSNTGLMFVAFSSILYSDLDKKLEIFS